MILNLNLNETNQIKSHHVHASLDQKLFFLNFILYKTLETVVH